MIDTGRGLTKVTGDFKALTQARQHQVEDCEPIPEEQKAAVRRLISANAVGENLASQVADAEELMKALGVHHSQDDEANYRVGVAPLPHREVVASTPPLLRPSWR